MKKDKFILPKNWYIIVTEENLKNVSSWRLAGDGGFLGKREWGCLPIGFLAGMCRSGADMYSKEHNPPNRVKSDTYDFGKEINFDQFKKHVLNNAEDFEITEDLDYLKKILKNLDLK